MTTSSLIKEIRKRDGRIVSFEEEKIITAIKKAFFAVTSDVHEVEAVAIKDSVVEKTVARIEKGEEGFVPSVEAVQDLVELAIMETGFLYVAKSYIIYRFEHAKLREEKKEKVQEKIRKSELFVKKRSGERELFSEEKIRTTISKASGGFENVVDAEALLSQCKLEVFDGINTREVAHVLVLVARSFIERDPAYTHVSSNLLLNNIIYKDALSEEGALGAGSFEDVYRNSFQKNIESGVKLEILDERLLDFDFSVLAEAILPERDRTIKYLGLQTLLDRYFIRDKSDKNQHNILETPQYMWMRVAMGLCLNEKNKESRAIEFYNALSTLCFVSSTPTLFNSGLVRSQLSSCFLSVVDDSLESIFKRYEGNAQLSKFAGGIGDSWTKVRGTGATVKGGGMESNGVVPFLKISDSVTVAISRSGRRRGATSAYLETWHYDIEEFLELRKNTGDDRRRTHDVNTANWIPDLFLMRVRDDQDWTLFSPDEAPDLHETYGRNFEGRYVAYEKLAGEGKMHLTKTLKARDLWKKMLTMLFETGHPWITFKDPSNVRSPQDHVGVIHSSNLCTEITLNTSNSETAVCNLGSVNLAQHITEGKLDVKKIGNTVRTGMRMLDNVVDLNFYPTEETRNSNLRHRPVGLGLMGFQDALYMQDIYFDSEEGVQFADYSMEVISYFAIQTSSMLAAEKGSYPSFRGSKWDRGIFPIDTLGILEKERGEEIPVPKTSKLNWIPVRNMVKKFGMRNSNCMAMAPTATIANIAGTLPTIEPIYKNIYVKANISGEFIIVNTYLIEDLKRLGLWNGEMLELIKGQEGNLQSISSIPNWVKRKYKEAFEIDPRWVVRLAAYRGKWIDQSQSLNIFFSGTSGKVLSDVYMYAWSMGLKTMYYLRTLAVSGVEKSTVQLGKQNVQSSVSHQTEDIAAAAVEEIKQRLTNTQNTMSEQMVPVKVLVETKKNQTVVSQVTESPKLCRIDDPECESCQ